MQAALIPHILPMDMPRCFLRLEVPIKCINKSFTKKFNNGYAHLVKAEIYLHNLDLGKKKFTTPASVKLVLPYQEKPSLLITSHCQRQRCCTTSCLLKFVCSVCCHKNVSAKHKSLTQPCQGWMNKEYIYLYSFICFVCVYVQHKYFNFFVQGYLQAQYSCSFLAVDHQKSVLNFQSEKYSCNTAADHQKSVYNFICKK